MRARSEPRSRLAVRVLKLIALSLVAWPLVAWAAARSLIVSAELPRADAIVMLSGSSAYVERTRYAAALWHAGRAPRIVLTNDGLRGGWSQSEQRNPFFVERATAELQHNGVSAAQIEVVPGGVTNTYTEAVALRMHAQARGWRSLLIVTSGYHARRAWWTFRRVFAGSGIELGLEPVPPGEQTPAPLWWWLRPAGWCMVVGEYGKLIYYEWYYR